MQMLRRMPHRCRGCQNRFYNYEGREGNGQQEMTDHASEIAQHSTAHGQIIIR
jgi:hypothetical protein